jgi:hypothetical protein
MNRLSFEPDLAPTGGSRNLETSLAANNRAPCHAQIFFLLQKR